MATLTFDTVWKRLGVSEGGWQANPEDKGNWTGGKVGVGELKGSKFGISAATYPHEDIKNLTPERAKEIFRTDWWVRLKMDRLPMALAYQVIDAAYHSGSHWGAVFLQRALGVKDDGIIGKDTIAAIAKVKDLDNVFFNFFAERLEFLTDTVAWKANSRGFVRRVARNMRYAAMDYEG